MGDDIGSGSVCFDFCSTKVVQLSNPNLYFYWFGCHHPLITQLSLSRWEERGLKIIDFETTWFLDGLLYIFVLITVSMQRERDELVDGPYRRDFLTYDNHILDGDIFLQALNGFLMILHCN